MGEVGRIHIPGPERLEVTTRGSHEREWIGDEGPFAIDATWLSEWNGTTLESQVMLQLKAHPELAAHVIAIREYVKRIMGLHPVG